MLKLTDKQKKFCEEYLIDLNATQAAIRAGYSEKTAAVIGNENLIKPYISDYIKTRQQELSESTKITTEWVIKRLKEISDRCMTAEPVLVWENGIKKPSGEYTFDSAGANRATELLGKHLGAFEADNKQKNDTVVVRIVKK